jgi:ATP-binding cassette subfamily B protein
LSAKVQEVSLYSAKIDEFYSAPSNIEPNEDGASVPDGPFELTLVNVAFSYPNSEFKLRNLNFTVKPGEKVAIVGENGAGKTTLSKLLLRLYDLDGGDILYDGVSIKDYNVHELRYKIGVAFQQPQTYAVTVRENLCIYGKADDSILQTNLQKVGLNLDLDAEVTREFDENGVVLSGGQAQKLALARLMHSDFGLLLLDEPSSALDPIAEYEIAKLMFDSSDTTTIMVAHRLSSIRNADRIYLISNGTIAEQGTHDELMALNGKYTDMFTKQAENYVK